VALVPLRDVSLAEQRANAVLVAAAPKLADELAAQVALNEETLSDLGDCDHSVGICYCGLRESIARGKALLESVGYGRAMFPDSTTGGTSHDN
jgi:hypothetical protein